ncbi:MAG: hypothetical protein H6711_10320 [Myxococcales bacterium]|nr:hypothetical protein [Myxococcales bacterium]
MLLTLLSALVGPQGPTVDVDLPPPPEAGAGVLQGVALLILIFAIAALVRHRRRMRAQGIGGLRSFALGAAVGNALFDLSAVLTPDRPAASSIKELEEAPIDDAIGDGRRRGDEAARPDLP